MLSGKVRVRPEIIHVEGPPSYIGGHRVPSKFPSPDKVLLVLQVEEAAHRVGHSHHDAQWRDATIEDLSSVDVGKLSLGLKAC